MRRYRVSTFCLNCKKSFEIRLCERARKFCTRKCFYDSRDNQELFELYFWRNVDKSGDCWVWTAGVTDSGYGNCWRRGRQIVASRASWEINKGQIPDGLWVLHKCDNRPCVRPAHLFLGTNSDNIKDCIAKGRYKSNLPGEKNESVYADRKCS